MVWGILISIGWGGGAMVMWRLGVVPFLLFKEEFPFHEVLQIRKVDETSKNIKWPVLANFQIVHTINCFTTCTGGGSALQYYSLCIALDQKNLGRGESLSPWINLLGHLIVVVIIGGVRWLELKQLYPNHPLLLLLGHEPWTICLHLVQVLAASALARSSLWSITRLDRST